MSSGRAVAGVLAGAWRSAPPQLEMPPEEVATITPLFLASGAGALAWKRLRHFSDQLLIIALKQLQETYLGYAIHAAEHEHQVAEVFRVLRSAGVEPILLKGWAIGRLYPEAGLRPTGDIDLCVAPTQHAKAQAVLNSPEYRRFWVDLEHDEISKFGARCLVRKTIYASCVSIYLSTVPGARSGYATSLLPWNPDPPPLTGSVVWEEMNYGQAGFFRPSGWRTDYWVHKYKICL